MPEKGNKLRKTFLHEGEFTSVKQEEMFGAAKWVGCDGVTRAPVLRASFRADAARRAEVTICGLGYFTMYLNGRRVSDDLFVPATSDYVRRPITVNGEPFDEEMGHRCYCLKYDLLPFWREGENELAFELAPGFFAEPMWSFDGNVASATASPTRRRMEANTKCSPAKSCAGTRASWKGASSSAAKSRI